MIKISPSILAADFGHLESECRSALDGGAHMLHFDVMDGHFVPNISFGIPVLRSLSRSLDAFFDVHLMISEPLKYVDAFADAGASLISFHIEADSDTRETIAAIKRRGLKAGLVLKPATDVSRLYEYLDDIDLVLIMTVEPGFGGQKFMPDMMPKVHAVAERARADMYIEVDGGIDVFTAPVAAAAGANLFVAGSSVFGSADRSAAISALIDAAKGDAC